MKNISTKKIIIALAILEALTLIPVIIHIVYNK